ncbi:uncharacterized protein [Henckelia pumila]|uniref:uncharacterized protein isoform X1 n=1 Tax=Henckelia pumila TaxID=405737 RepID=UPI003C6E59DD
MGLYQEKNSKRGGLFDEIRDIIIISWNFLGELLVTFSPFFVIFMAFVAFVCWNGSIVLGAKDSHEQTLLLISVHHGVNNLLPFCEIFQDVAINFGKSDDIKILRDRAILQYSD